MSQRRRGFRRERVTPLTPREERIVALLRERPHSAQELADVFGTSVPTMRTALSRLAKKVGLVSLFWFGQTRYALEEDAVDN